MNATTADSLKADDSLPPHRINTSVATRGASARRSWRPALGFRCWPKRVKLSFFSSGRRHTRSLCDWSSDVCSSDLLEALRHRPYQSIIEINREGKTVFTHATQGHTYHARKLPDGHYVWIDACGEIAEVDANGKLIAKSRSEERRVGKECRSRWSPYH